MKRNNIAFKELVHDKGGYWFQFPYVAVYGRSDGAIILNGANIYLNSFKEALDQPDLVDFHTGKFRVSKIETENSRQNYRVEIELESDVKESVELEK